MNERGANIDLTGIWKFYRKNLTKGFPLTCLSAFIFAIGWAGLYSSSNIVMGISAILATAGCLWFLGAWVWPILTFLILPLLWHILEFIKIIVSGIQSILKLYSGNPKIDN